MIWSNSCARADWGSVKGKEDTKRLPLVLWRTGRVTAKKAYDYERTTMKSIEHVYRIEDRASRLDT